MYSSSLWQPCSYNRHKTIFLYLIFILQLGSSLHKTHLVLFFTIFLLFWQKASFSVYGNKLKIVLCGVSFFIAPYVTIGAGRRCDVNLNFHLRNHMGDKPLICVIFIYNFTHSYIHSCCNFVMIILDSIIALCVIKRYNLTSI